MYLPPGRCVSVLAELPQGQCAVLRRGTGTRERCFAAACVAPPLRGTAGALGWLGGVTWGGAQRAELRR